MKNANTGQTAKRLNIRELQLIRTCSLKDELKEVHTPDIKTIDDLAAFFKCEEDSFLKSIIYVADGKPLMVVVPGSREINEHKLTNYLGAVELELATDAVVEEVTGAPVGFAGPVTDKKIRMIFDISVKDMINAVTGANKKDYHLLRSKSGKGLYNKRGS